MIFLNSRIYDCFNNFIDKKNISYFKWYYWNSNLRSFGQNI